MNYQETVDYMIGMLPMFQRIGAAAYRADLGNALALDAYFDSPHKKYKCIHVAGTNGKGSTSHYLASILQSVGYRTALYTSPHLIDFRERIKINGVMIEEQAVVDFIHKSKSCIEEIQPSFFELTMAMAFQYFADQKVEIAVIEVGMGGRLDSTNIIDPILSIITNIGLDHTDFLGNTLEAIAGEKAGIIKKHTPLVVSQSQLETRNVFETKAIQMDAPIVFADDEYKTFAYETKSILTQNIHIIYKGINKITFETDLLGFCQHKNLCGVLKAVDILKLQGFKISEEALRDGILMAARQTGLKGRWQIINEKPLTICDTGHNEDGIQTVLEQLATCKYDNLHYVFGMVNDKNIQKILSILPKNAIYYFTKANLPRALDERKLQEQASVYGLIGTSYVSVSEAYQSARQKASQNDMIFIGGSTFVVAEIV